MLLHPVGISRSARLKPAPLWQLAPMTRSPRLTSEAACSGLSSACCLLRWASPSRVRRWYALLWTWHCSRCRCGLLAGLPSLHTATAVFQRPNRSCGAAIACCSRPLLGVCSSKAPGEWHWICDETINAYQQHTFAVGSDGTLYATDRAGMQVSRDGGCMGEHHGAARRCTS